MKYSFTFLLVASLFLVSCAETEKMHKSAEDILEVVQDTMSGKTLEDIKEDGGELLEGVKETKQEIEDRLEKVTTGIEKIREGKSLIGEGLDGQSSSEEE